MEYRIFHRVPDKESDVKFHMSGVYSAEKRGAALKHYAMQVKEYGIRNTIFAVIPEVTCVCVEILFEGQMENSQ